MCHRDQIGFCVLVGFTTITAVVAKLSHNNMIFQRNKNMENQPNQTMFNDDQLWNKDYQNIFKDLPVIYVSNIPPDVSSSFLTQFLENQKLRVVNMEMLLKGKKGRKVPTGLAVVHLENEEEVDRACLELNDMKIQDNKLHVSKQYFV
eukprot:TRINITY_DN4031_c0_g1_i11.p4 TRINITY_DN4031_c0_g1~~TRINITY_DN4031_c0_g1_i11.p4  ORF type:complete len:148 (-),score=16.62 TRINITY_DN4031_c0_g1_i11:1333-1776(-)